MISLCTTVKNRSRVRLDSGELRLFPNCVKSIVDATEKSTECELIVADWKSEDWPLREWLPQAAQPLAVEIISLDGGFSRGAGLNRAAEAARGDVLFFIDADALICRELINRGAELVTQGKAFFPVLFSFNDPRQESGWWRHEGYGHCMLSTDLFKRSGGWPEYRKWGREDDDFFARISQLAEVVREEVPGFYHQWHPDELLWKNQYSADYENMVKEQKLSAALRDELMRLVPAGETVILVDEGRFDSDWLPERKAIPFLERDGIYWGNPADDEVALAELARLQQQGVRYVAFAWMAFWWLDYYKSLAKHLTESCQCVVRNQVVVLFDTNR